MKPLLCHLGLHDDMGHVAIRCLRCGRITPGLRGPVVPEVKPVVKVRKRRVPKPVPLRVVKARKTA
jgi:hypothetical protein